MTKPFSEGHFYRRRSFIPSELKKDGASCSYVYKSKVGNRKVYVWYQSYEFINQVASPRSKSHLDPRDDFLSSKKRYRCKYIKRVFDSSDKLISEKRGTFYT